MMISFPKIIVLGGILGSAGPLNSLLASSIPNQQIFEREKIESLMNARQRNFRVILDRALGGAQNIRVGGTSQATYSIPDTSRRIIKGFHIIGDRGAGVNDVRIELGEEGLSELNQELSNKHCYWGNSVPTKEVNWTSGENHQNQRMLFKLPIGTWWLNRCTVLVDRTIAQGIANKKWLWYFRKPVVN